MTRFPLILPALALLCSLGLLAMGALPGPDGAPSHFRLAPNSGGGVLEPENPEPVEVMIAHGGPGARGPSAAA